VSSPSIQSRITALAVAALNGSTVGVTAYRSKMAAFSQAQLPAINVLPDEGDTEYNDTDSADRRFRFKVRYTGIAVDECDAAIDPIYVAGNIALLADPKFGGLAIFTRELSSKWEMEKGLFDTVALVVLYETEFSTSRLDPSASWA
jgi:hypothetical protein